MNTPDRKVSFQSAPREKITIAFYLAILAALLGILAALLAFVHLTLDFISRLLT
jgi:hypothetical protein